MRLLLALGWSISEASIPESYIRKTKATERLNSTLDLTKFMAIEKTSTLALWAHSEIRTDRNTVMKTEWQCFVAK